MLYFNTGGCPRLSVPKALLCVGKTFYALLLLLLQGMLFMAFHRLECLLAIFLIAGDCVRSV